MPLDLLSEDYISGVITSFLPHKSGLAQAKWTKKFQQRGEVIITMASNRDCVLIQCRILCLDKHLDELHLI